MCLEEVARVEMGGEIGCDELFVLSAGLAGRGSRLHQLVRARQTNDQTYHDGAFAPTTIPVT